MFTFKPVIFGDNILPVIFGDNILPAMLVMTGYTWNSVILDQGDKKR